MSVKIRCVTYIHICVYIYCCSNVGIQNNNDSIFLTEPSTHLKFFPHVVAINVYKLIQICHSIPVV